MILGIVKPKQIVFPTATTAQIAAFPNPKNGQCIVATDGNNGLWCYYGVSWLEYPYQV